METCDTIKADCKCMRLKNHTGVHVCDCGGAYLDDEIFAWPVYAGTITSIEEADEMAKEFD